MTEDTLTGDFIPASRKISLEVEPEQVNDSDVLDFTQNIRKQIVTMMVQDGIPSTKEDTQTLLDTMRDMDRTALGRMRIQTDKDNNTNGRLAQEIVERLFKINPQGMAADQPVRDEIPVIDDSELPDVQFDPATMVCGVITDTAEEFIKRFEGSNTPAGDGE